MSLLRNHFWLRTIVIALLSSFTAWGLALLVSYNIFSTSAFTSTEKSTDFELSDLYQSAASKRAVSHLSNDIVLVGIDSLDRDGIACILDAISFMEPRAIGVDLLFPYRRQGDDLLIESFNTNVPIVLAADIRYDKRQGRFIRHPGNWFDPIPNASYGVVNFPVSHNQNVIRSYTSNFNLGDTLLFAFAQTVARAAGVSTTPEDGQPMILFPSVEFSRLTPHNLITSNGAPRMEAEDCIAGKIVLVGTLEDTSDQHLTPVDPAMSGVQIHATILENLLSNKFIRYFPHWLEVLLAWLLCFCLIVFMNIAKEKWSKVGNLAVRVFQAILIYTLFVIGCNAFVRRNLYIDFSLALLMTGLGAFAFDLIYGLLALSHKLKKKK